MARKNRRSDAEDAVDLDEVDAFNANREKILLDEAGDYLSKNASDDEPSDEEVLALNDGEDQAGYDDQNEDMDSDEFDVAQDDEEVEEEGLGWGSKENYYGGDDASDDDEEMAKEAVEQQKKHLQDLEMEDFLDEDMMEDWKKTADKYDDSKTSQNQLVINEETSKSLGSLDKDDKLKLLKSSFPEFVPLLKEYSQLNETLVSYNKLSKKNQLINTKITALSCYLGTISSYFALFAEHLKTGERFLSMKEEPVMESILSLREVWRQAKELPEEEVETMEEEQEIAGSESEEMPIVASEEVLESEEASEEESEEEEQEEDTKANEDLEIDINKRRNIKKISKKNVDDFIESATPETVDMEDKNRRKRSLRFYTSKIDQASNKNSDRYGGDMDLPYKERLFERQQRLLEEARKRGLGQTKEKLGDDLDDNDMNSDEERVAHEINDDYYNDIKQSKQDKKSARREAHELAVKAAKEGKLAELQESLDEEGKRALNFQILKNKGLTRNRKNVDRNARVKKRKKYDKAQKKLKSVRQVYEGENRGPYEGEKTGIKKGLSRSVKLV
ncbi:hypothetical protein QCA50_017431 [Cerrena zonata]|uniref:Sas10 C-terminal domain-containing protein n=1 Tax=Cerrena zonata TaxID=2478898 RepID=A0AAW0FDD1_9APHY